MQVLPQNLLRGWRRGGGGRVCEHCKFLAWFAPKTSRCPNVLIVYCRATLLDWPPKSLISNSIFINWVKFKRILSRDQSCLDSDSYVTYNYEASSTPRPQNLKKLKFENFISTVRPTIHTNPSQKRSFSKMPFKPERFENAGFAFKCRRKTFWKRLVNQVIFFLKHKSK